MIKIDNHLPIASIIFGIVALSVAAITAHNTIDAHGRYIAKLEQRLDEVEAVQQNNTISTAQIKIELIAIRESLSRIENKMASSKTSKLEREGM